MRVTEDSSAVFCARQRHSGTAAPYGSSQNSSSTSNRGARSLLVIEPPAQSDRAFNPLHRGTPFDRPLGTSDTRKLATWLANEHNVLQEALGRKPTLAEHRAHAHAFIEMVFDGEEKLWAELAARKDPANAAPMSPASSSFGSNGY